MQTEVVVSADGGVLIDKDLRVNTAAVCAVDRCWGSKSHVMESLVPIVAIDTRVSRYKAVTIWLGCAGIFRVDEAAVSTILRSRGASHLSRGGGSPARTLNAWRAG